MPQGDKSKYTDKQKRQAAHIEASYEERGVPEEEAAARAWATVNRQDHGGKMPGGGGRGKTPDFHPNGNGPPAKKAGAAKKTSAAKKAGAAKKTSGPKAGAAKKNAAKRTPAKKAAAKKAPAKKAPAKRKAA